jgi:hypothetical protein
MQRDPDDRYSNAPDFAIALATAARGDGDGHRLGRLFGR